MSPALKGGTLNINVPPELRKQVEVAAQKRLLSRSALVRMILTEWLVKYEQSATMYDEGSGS